MTRVGEEAIVAVSKPLSRRSEGKELSRKTVSSFRSTYSIDYARTTTSVVGEEEEKCRGKMESLDKILWKDAMEKLRYDSRGAKF